MSNLVRVHKVVKITPKSEWAEECVADYGSVLRQYQESDGGKWFTDVTEEDPINFKHWSFYLKHEEADVTEIKL